MTGFNETMTGFNETMIRFHETIIRFNEREVRNGTLHTGDGEREREMNARFFSANRSLHFLFFDESCPNLADLSPRGRCRCSAADLPAAWRVFGFKRNHPPPPTPPVFCYELEKGSKIRAGECPS